MLQCGFRRSDSRLPMYGAIQTGVVLIYDTCHSPFLPALQIPSGMAFRLEPFRIRSHGFRHATIPAIAARVPSGSFTRTVSSPSSFAG